MTIPMGRAERRRAPGRPHQFLHALHLQGFQTMKEVAQAFLLWAVVKSRSGCLKIVESLWIMGFHSIYQLVQDFFHPQELWRVTLKAAPKNMKAPAGCLRLSSYLCHENIAIFASFWGMPLRIYIQFIHEWTKEICGTATSAEFMHEGMMSMICVPFKETNYQWPLDWQGVQNVLVIMSFLNVTSIIYPLGLWFIPFFSNVEKLPKQFFGPWNCYDSPRINPVTVTGGPRFFGPIPQWPLGPPFIPWK